MNCSKFKKRISLFYDDRLDKRENQAIEEHLAHCSVCNEEFRQLSLACRLASALPQHAPATDGWESLQAQLLSTSSRPLPARKPALRLAFAGGLALLLVLAALGLFWTSQPGVNLVEDKPATVDEPGQKFVDNPTKSGARHDNNPEKTAGFPLDNTDSTGMGVDQQTTFQPTRRPVRQITGTGPIGAVVQNNRIEQLPQEPAFSDSLVSLEPDPEYSEPEALAQYNEEELLDLIDEGLDPLVSAASLYSDPLDWLMVLNDQEWL